MARRAAILLAVLPVLLSCRAHEPAVSSVRNGSQPARTIVLVTLDVLRADHLGCYGYSRATSPDIDALAAQSLVFENAYSPTPTSAPANASLMTSLYPRAHGALVAGRDRLSAQLPRLGDILTRAGYRAMADYGLRKDAPEELQGVLRVFDAWDNPGAIERFIGIDPNEKLFLYVNLGAVHLPYLPTRNPFSSESRLDMRQYLRDVYDYGKVFLSRYPDSRRYLPRYEAALSGDYTQERLSEFMRLHHTLLPIYYAQRIVMDQYWKHFDLRNPKDRAYLTMLYDARALELQQGLSKVLAVLKKSGRYEDAVIIFTSQHGEEFMEHGRESHTDLHEETLHVPLLIRIPGIRPRRVKALAQLIDIMPTVLELARAPAPTTAQGRSLTPLFKPGLFQREVNQYVFAEYNGAQALRSRRWAYIRQSSGTIETEELYDRFADREERRDLAALRPGILGGLRRRLDHWAAATASVPITGELPAGLDEEIKKHILKTGYW